MEMMQEPVPAASASPATAAATTGSAGEDGGRTERISNAVTFLQDPRIRNATLVRKIHFLSGKGLSVEEISEAFGNAGQPQQLTVIKNIIANKPAVAAPPPAATQMSVGQAGGATLAPPTAYPANVVYAQPQQVLPSLQQQQQLMYRYQQPMQPQLVQMQEANSNDGGSWKDYVIAAGAALIGGFGAYKAFDRYSPWELRRKDDLAPLSTRLASGSRSRRRGDRGAYNSGEANTPISVGPEFRSRPLPQTPSPPPTSGAATPGGVGGVAGIGDVHVPNSVASPISAENGAAPLPADELQRLRAELVETKEILDKERKGRAELAVTNGRLKGQVQQLSRTSERQQEQIKTLQGEAKDLREKLEKFTADEATKSGTAEGEAAEEGKDAKKSEEAEAKPAEDSPAKEGSTASENADGSTATVESKTETAAAAAAPPSPVVAAPPEYTAASSASSVATGVPPAAETVALPPSASLSTTAAPFVGSIPPTLAPEPAIVSPQPQPQAAVNPIQESIPAADAPTIPPAAYDEE